MVRIPGEVLLKSDVTCEKAYRLSDPLLLFAKAISVQTYRVTE